MYINLNDPAPLMAAYRAWLEPSWLQSPSAATRSRKENPTLPPSPPLTRHLVSDCSICAISVEMCLLHHVSEMAGTL